MPTRNIYEEITITVGAPGTLVQLNGDSKDTQVYRIIGAASPTVITQDWPFIHSGAAATEELTYVIYYDANVDIITNTKDVSFMGYKLDKWQASTPHTIVCRLMNAVWNVRVLPDFSDYPFGIPDTQRKSLILAGESYQLSYTKNSKFQDITAAGPLTGAVTITHPTTPPNGTEFFNYFSAAITYGGGGSLSVFGLTISAALASLTNWYVYCRYVTGVGWRTIILNNYNASNFMESYTLAQMAVLKAGNLLVPGKLYNITNLFTGAVPLWWSKGYFNGYFNAISTNQLDNNGTLLWDKPTGGIGYIELSGGAGTINITVDGVAVTTGAVPWAGSLVAMAAAVAGDINIGLAVHRYYAFAVNDRVVLRHLDGGAAVNGDVVASVVTGALVATDHNIAGGLNASNRLLNCHIEWSFNYISELYDKVFNNRINNNLLQGILEFEQFLNQPVVGFYILDVNFVLDNIFPSNVAVYYKGGGVGIIQFNYLFPATFSNVLFSGIIRSVSMQRCSLSHYHMDGNFTGTEMIGIDFSYKTFDGLSENRKNNTIIYQFDITFTGGAGTGAVGALTMPSGGHVIFSGFLPLRCLVHVITPLVSAGAAVINLGIATDDTDAFLNNVDGLFSNLNINVVTETTVGVVAATVNRIMVGSVVTSPITAGVIRVFIEMAYA